MNVAKNVTVLSFFLFYMTLLIPSSVTVVADDSIAEQKKSMTSPLLRPFRKENHRLLSSDVVIIRGDIYVPFEGMCIRIRLEAGAYLVGNPSDPTCSYTPPYSTCTDPGSWKYKKISQYASRSGNVIQFDRPSLKPKLWSGTLTLVDDSTQMFPNVTASDLDRSVATNRTFTVTINVKSMVTSMTSSQPSEEPSNLPSSIPSSMPSSEPSSQPSEEPSDLPSSSPFSNPLTSPSSNPSASPSPTETPSMTPSLSTLPSIAPTKTASMTPSLSTLSSLSSKPSSVLCNPNHQMSVLISGITDYFYRDNSWSLVNSNGVEVASNENITGYEYFET